MNHLLGIALAACLAATGQASCAADIAMRAAGKPELDPSGARPAARNGAFVTRDIQADGAARVVRAVTRVRYAADERPASRPAHPLGDERPELASAAIPATPETARPELRPAGFFERFRNRASGNDRYSPKGSVCGVNAIKGVRMKSFGNPGGGCGVSNPVKVVQVAGIRLSEPATIDCVTAKALNSWAERGIKPAFGSQGGGVAELELAGHYACRRRNNRPQGKLSEHARGHALDVSALVLQDGTRISVLKGWHSDIWGDEMKKVHRMACGPFGTVLGPRANRYHQDHFHVDTARNRSGPYCR